MQSLTVNQSLRHQRTDCVEEVMTWCAKGRNPYRQQQGRHSFSPTNSEEQDELSSNDAPICAGSGASSVLGGGIDREGEIVLLRF